MSLTGRRDSVEPRPWPRSLAARFSRRRPSRRRAARVYDGVAVCPVRELKMQNLDVSTVVFAVVAIFVIFKLRSVLGTRTGAERRPLDPTAPPREPGANGNIVSIGTVARAGGPAPPADR